RIVADVFPTREGQQYAEQEDLAPVVRARALTQVLAIYSDRSFEIRKDLLSGNTQFGSIRIGVSMVLVRDELQQALTAAGGTVLATLLISSFVAMLLAQLMLRPIHI